MINKLTSEQESKLTVYRDKWMEIGLSTGRCNKEESKKLICDAYKIAGLQEPEHWIYCESPLSAGIVLHIFKNNKQLIKNSVWDSVCDSVCDSVWDSVCDSV